MPTDVPTLAGVADDLDTLSQQHAERAVGHTDRDTADREYGTSAGYAVAATVCGEIAATADRDGVIDARQPLDAAHTTLTALLIEFNSGNRQVPSALTHGSATFQAAAWAAVDDARGIVHAAVHMYPDTLAELAAMLTECRDNERWVLAPGSPAVADDTEHQYRTGCLTAFEVCCDETAKAAARVGDAPDGVGEQDAVAGLLAALDAIVEDHTWAGDAAGPLDTQQQSQRRGWRDTLRRCRAVVVDVAARLAAADDAKQPGPPDEPDPPRVPTGTVWDDYPKVLRPDDAVGDLPALAMFLGGSHDSFTGDLLRLIAKADPHNLNRLAEGFPEHVAAFLMWRAMSPIPAGTLAQILAITHTLPRR